MTNKRNPFPAIGKVIKYDFKHSARKLLPLYGVLLVIGTICGLLTNPNNFVEISSNEFSFSITSNSNTNSTLEMAQSVSGIAYFILIITSIIVTAVILEHRFKNSMFGEEAYLNHSLPVTVGEHLWGRIISTILWNLICFAVIFLSFFLCFSSVIIVSGGISVFNEGVSRFIEEFNIQRSTNLNIKQLIFYSILIFCSTLLVFTTFTFLVDSTAQLFPKNKTLLEFIFAIVLIVLTVNVLRLLPEAKNVWEYVLYTLGLSGVYFTGMYFIFAKNLNLE